MDIFRTMFKPRPSQSPVISNSIKRHNNESPDRQAKFSRTENNNHVDQKPKFTYDQVKTMLEAILQEKEKSKRLLISGGLKHFDFSTIAVPGHSPEECKELIEQLVKNTRRVRTLTEVVSEIKDNLDRRAYTEIIQKATMDASTLPKRPPSAYLLYHQDRYHHLKHENPLAADVSKIVSEEWKHLSDRKRREYVKRYNDLMRTYENAMNRLGLVTQAAPKRPPNARNLFIQDRIESTSTDDCSPEDLIALQRQFGEEFDALEREDKKYWTGLAKEKMDVYRQEREEFSLNNPHLKPIQRPGPKANGTSREKAKKPDMPIPPRSALKLYFEKKMPEGVEGEEAEELKRKLKDKFNQLSAKKQIKFIKKAIKDKARYERDVEEFVEQHPDYAEKFKNKEIRPSLTREQWKLYQIIVENRPVIPTPTAYLYYCGKMLGDETYSVGQEPTQRMQKASIAWRNLSDKEKSMYEDEHIDVIETYITEMTDWLDRQDPEKKKQVLLEEPRCNPEYWRKRLSKLKKRRNPD